MEYTCNGNGLRTKKDFGDKSINYYYNGGNIILETDQNNMVTAKNIRGLQLISRQTQTNTLFYLHNAHGDVTQLLDENGQVIEDYRYDPYGNEEDGEAIAFGGQQTQSVWRQEIEKIDNPFRYCGEYLDEETRNYYLRARYYSCEISRFITEDPIKDGPNWYVYCSNNPVNFTDPKGLFDYNTRLSPNQKYNDDVKILQHKLVELGYMVAPSPNEWGYFGDDTLRAVNKYKADQGLGNKGKDWGVVGKQTWETLRLIYRTQRDIDAGVIIETIDFGQYFDVTVPVRKAILEAANEAAKHPLDFGWFKSKVDHKHV